MRNLGDHIHAHGIPGGGRESDVEVSGYLTYHQLLQSCKSVVMTSVDVAIKKALKWNAGSAQPFKTQINIIIMTNDHYYITINTIIVIRTYRLVPLNASATISKFSRHSSQALTVAALRIEPNLTKGARVMASLMTTLVTPLPCCK